MDFVEDSEYISEGDESPLSIFIEEPKKKGLTRSPRINLSGYSYVPKKITQTLE